MFETFCPGAITKKRCWKNVSYKMLLQICQLFWSLTKPAQDAVLWAMQSGGVSSQEDSHDEGSESSGDGETESRSSQVKWFLAGTHVCRRAFQKMLGIGSGRLNRTRGRFQGLDERTLKGQGPQARPALATASVNNFLQKLYYSVSESMPTGILGLQLTFKNEVFSCLGCQLAGDP